MARCGHVYVRACALVTRCAQARSVHCSNARRSASFSRRRLCGGLPARRERGRVVGGRRPCAGNSKVCRACERALGAAPGLRRVRGWDAPARRESELPGGAWAWVCVPRGKARRAGEGPRTSTSMMSPGRVSEPGRMMAARADARGQVATHRAHAHVAGPTGHGGGGLALALEPSTRAGGAGGVRTVSAPKGTAGLGIGGGGRVRSERARHGGGGGRGEGRRGSQAHNALVTYRPGPFPPCLPPLMPRRAPRLCLRLRLRVCRFRMRDLCALLPSIARPATRRPEPSTPGQSTPGRSAGDRAADLGAPPPPSVCPSARLPVAVRARRRPLPLLTAAPRRRAPTAHLAAPPVRAAAPMAASRRRPRAPSARGLL